MALPHQNGTPHPRPPSHFLPFPLSQHAAQTSQCILSFAPLLAPRQALHFTYTIPNFAHVSPLLYLSFGSAPSGGLVPQSMQNRSWRLSPSLPHCPLRKLSANLPGRRSRTQTGQTKMLSSRAVSDCSATSSAGRSGAEMRARKCVQVWRRWKAPGKVRWDIISRWSSVGRASRVGCGGVERVRPLRDSDILQSKRSADWKGVYQGWRKTVGASN